MEYFYIGKIVNTHALKGELRIISNAEYKDKIFNIGNDLYIGNNKEKYIIKTYRKHKNYDMVLFENINGINDVINLKGNNVYVDKKLFEDVILDIDLVNALCYYNDKIIGKVINVINNNGYKVFDLESNLIPYNDDFIESISKDKIIFKNIGGLIDGIYKSN